jgi:hypothetical protein
MDSLVFLLLRDVQRREDRFRTDIVILTLRHMPALPFLCLSCALFMQKLHVV